MVFLKKWLKWEFWPWWFFYIPIYLKYFWMSFKAGSLSFFTASNPLMEFGGFMDYSKFNVLKAIDKKYLPVTEFFKKANKAIILKRMQDANLSYPIILKPDIGERGFGVEKIDSEIDLTNYFQKYGAVSGLILQEYINYTLELGIMYSRKASEEKGQITSIVMKEFLTITGDGEHTIEELILSDKRTSFYIESLTELYGEGMQVILPNGKDKELVAIGNHSRGTTFLNANHLINDKLITVFDEISLPINGFHFGRYDLRVSSIEDLNNGKNIKIMELNAAASEPAHIYDPNMSLKNAYQYLFKHWNRLYEISVENHENGNAYSSFPDLCSAINKRVKFKKTV